MVASSLGMIGAVTFIFGRSLQGGGKLQRSLSNWLWMTGGLVVLVMTYQVWSLLGETTATEPLFILVWIGLPMLWSYREESMAVPMREVLIAALWALIAVLLCDLMTTKLGCVLSQVNFLPAPVPENTSGASLSLTSYGIASLGMSMVLYAALETDPVLRSTNKWPWFFTLAYTGLFLGFLALLGDSFPSGLNAVVLVLLAVGVAIVVRLWFVIKYMGVWWRVFWSPVLFLGIVGTSFGVLVGFSK